MPLTITHFQWMNETRRGLLTTRSSDLKAIDEALFTYGITANMGHDPGTALVALKKALEDWIKAKSGGGQNWRDSTRNIAPGHTGKGIVERLHDEVLEEINYNWIFTFVQKKSAGVYKHKVYSVQSAFISFGGAPPCDAGWKFHVNAPLDQYGARKCADEILPLLRQHQIWHKLPLNMKTMQELYQTDDERGKFITIYSKNPAQAREIARELFTCDWTRGFARNELGEAYSRGRLGWIDGDVQIAGMENVYCRYGAYVGKFVPGPAPGTRVRDDRSNGWPSWLPGWGEMLARGERDYPPVGSTTIGRAQAEAQATGPHRNRTTIGPTGN
jgi:hypothetical protein